EWLADRVEIERLGDHYEEKLAQAGFFFPETKAAAMRLNLRNMWSRLVLTRGDVRILHGVLRQLTRR
ncbi:MAG TPA: RNA methyltransferase, partial [Paracoccus sp.]|nr:RNA methyltransferase [Paracoccus sp. (in: a-proteobacteria)]